MVTAPHTQMGSSCQRLMLVLVTHKQVHMFPCQQAEMCRIVLDQFPCGSLDWKPPDITVSHMEDMSCLRFS